MNNDQNISPIVFIQNDIDTRIPELDRITLMHPKGVPVIFIKKGKDILELQTCEPRKYGSWFINQRICSNGSYSLATKIDPKFLCLPYLEKSDKFSPLDQIMIYNEGCDRLPLTDSKEWGLDSICDINSSFGEHMILYKYNEAKTLSWLKEKINKISKTIAKQRIIRELKGNINFVTTFNSGAKVNILEESKNTNNLNDEIKVDDDDFKVALQIVCDYLTESMISKITKFMNFEISDLYTSVSSNQKRKTDWELEMEIEKETMGFDKKAIDNNSSVASNVLSTANTNSQPKKKATTNADKKNLKPIPGVKMQQLSSFFSKK